ncbi:Conserved_hypothetical protein [Hexamita inflata]|uniref:Uncharacterized protein n=1 Tax=Hexamita inflata TaxID=28002 RepID=A0AA86TYK8_9EUKA|nr:Conserved hypothetical protein [Hexamita inflata]
MSNRSDFEYMTVPQLLDFIQEESTTIEQRNFCLKELQKRDMGEGTIPERVMQEHNVASAVNYAAQNAQSELHGAVIKFQSDDLNHFLESLHSISSKVANPLNLPHNIFIDAFIPNTIVGLMNPPINGDFMAQQAIAVLEKPEKKKKERVELEEREKAKENFTSKQAEWGQKRLLAYEKWVSQKPIPYTQAFVSKQLTVTVNNFFNLSQLVSQGKVKVVEKTSQEAQKLWPFKNETELKFVVKSKGEEGIGDVRAECLTQAYIDEIERKYGINQEIFSGEV